MLCLIWRIFYQLGESHLNVFWYHIVENLLSVAIFYQIWIIFYQILREACEYQNDEFWEKFQTSIEPPIPALFLEEYIEFLWAHVLVFAHFVIQIYSQYVGKFAI